MQSVCSEARREQKGCGDYRTMISVDKMEKILRGVLSQVCLKEKVFQHIHTQRANSLRSVHPDSLQNSQLWDFTCISMWPSYQRESFCGDLQVIGYVVVNVYILTANKRKIHNARNINYPNCAPAAE